MTTASRFATAEELVAMPDNERRELYEGEVRAVPPANMRHGHVAVQISTHLTQYAKPRDLGYVVTESGYVLQRNPDTVVGPDISFLKKSRAPAGGLPEKFFEGHPDLAVEIISPRNSRQELEEKMRIYMRHGTALGWLVDANARTVEVYRPGQAVLRLGETEEIAGETAVPGIRCRVSEFFD